MAVSNRVGVVIVSYGHEDQLFDLLGSITTQMKKTDKVVLVDNHPNRKGADVGRKFKQILVIEADNKGFSNGCNIGAEAVIHNVDALFFLNPDTKPSNNVLDVIRGVDTNEYAAWMPLLVLPDGRVNSAGNVVHTSGLSWCDGYKRLPEEYEKIVNISVLSGACAVVGTEWWDKLNGISEDYFLYYEDTDLSTRILLSGGHMGLFTDGLVEHDYDYAKGTHKWMYIERNRPIYIIRTWPTGVIIVLALQLFLVGIGLWLVAILQGRFKSKVRSLIMFARVLPVTLKQRKAIQSTRKISSYEFMRSLVYKLNTPVLGKLGEDPVVEFLFMVYYKFALGVLYIFK